MSGTFPLTKINFGKPYFPGIKRDGTKFDSLDEPMHVVINGPSPEAVKNAGDEIRALIKLQIDDPDCEKMVAMRAAHMHELAVLNGTLKV